MADMGVGEVMLLSAAVGAGTGAAIDKEDPLKGALIGGGLGAIGGYGIGPAGAGLVGAEAAPAVATTAELAPAAAGSTATGLGGAGYTTGAGAGLSSLTSVPTGAGGYLTGAGASGLSGAGITGASALPAGLGGTGYAGLGSSTLLGGAAPAASSVAPQVGSVALKGAFQAGVQQGAGSAAGSSLFGGMGGPLAIGAGTLGLGALLKQDQNRYGVPQQETYTGPLSKFKYDPDKFTPTYATPNVYQVPKGYADGGIASLNQTQNQDMGLAGQSDTMFPQSQQDKTQYATPSQLPTSAQVLASDYDTKTNPYTGTESPLGMADGGIASLGSYSDGGRMLKGPGDGVSDSIPASIGAKQPARLADGEFVVPARAVSELGNGSTDAGAKQLYAMLNRIENKRKRGKGLAYQANPKKMMPA